VVEPSNDDRLNEVRLACQEELATGFWEVIAAAAMRVATWRATATRIATPKK